MLLQSKKKTGLLKRKGAFRIIDQTHVLAKSDTRSDADKDWNMLLTEKTSSTQLSRARSFSNSMHESAAPPNPVGAAAKGTASKQAPGAGKSLSMAPTPSPSTIRAVPEPPKTKVPLENLSMF